MSIIPLNKLKHEPAIIAQFEVLLHGSLDAKKSAYVSLKALVADLDKDLNQRASNAHYLTEKTGLFLHACEEVAGLKDPTNSYEQSVGYAEDNFTKVQAMAQWK